ncbi:TPA: hypothetical protein RFO28_003153, partial [Legionella pneumophila]|nr:hypothetical protein [Legionella pneumophila]
MNKCWLCGDIATTREHRIKKTTVNYLFLYEKNPTITVGKKIKKLQSPNSGLIKYDYNLCQKCNCERTQPFDRAYEKFFEYLIQNQKSILKNRRVKVADLEIDQQNLFKYFIKSFCCMVDSSHTKPVPKELIDTLLGADYNKSLVIQFCINMATINYPLTKVMMTGESMFFPYTNDEFYMSYYEAYGWLNIRYIYQTVWDKREYNFRLNKNNLVP